MKLLLHIALILLILPKVYGQDAEELKNLIRNSDDSTRATIYQQLGELYFESDIDSSFYFYNMAMAYAKRSKQYYVWASSLSYAGLAQATKGDNEKASLYLKQSLQLIDSLNIENINLAGIHLALAKSVLKQSPMRATLEAKKSLALFESEDNSNGMLQAYELLGEIYSIRKNYKEGIIFISKAIDLSREQNNRKRIGENLVKKAELYHLDNNIPKALEYFYQAIDIGDNISDPELSASAKIQVAEIYMVQRKYQQAISLFTTVLKYYQAVKDRAGEMMMNYSLGLANKSKSDVRIALQYFFNSFEIARELEDHVMMAKNYNERARCYLLQNRVELAQRNAEWALELATRHKLTEQLMHVNLIFSDIHSKSRKYGPALTYYKRYSEFRDQLNQTTRDKEFLMLEEEYKNREQEIESIYYEKEKENQLKIAKTEERGEMAVKAKDNEVFQLNAKNDKLKNNTLIGSMILLLFFSLGTIIAYKNKLDDNKLLINQRDEIVKQKEDLLKKNKRLVDLNEEKDSLVNMVAHDLRSPLDQIKGLVNVINMNSDVSKKSQDYLDMISFAADRMRGLIGRTLNIRNIDKQEVDPKIEVFDVSKVVDEIINNFVELANRKSLTIHSELQRNGCLIKADMNYFIQVLENLISNAIKFSPKEKSIRLKVGKVEDVVRIEVIDQGPGIREEDMERLFKKFQRLSARPTGDEDSTGLGLSIVKRFVDAMGGKVYCESTFGKGANFIVEFEAFNHD